MCLPFLLGAPLILSSMLCAKEDLEWSLFDPVKVPDLCELHGSAFEKRYAEYESLGYAVEVVKARSIWVQIVQSQIKTGGPFILFKDAVNGLYPRLVPFTVD